MSCNCAWASLGDVPSRSLPNTLNGKTLNSLPSHRASLRGTTASADPPANLRPTRYRGGTNPRGSTPTTRAPVVRVVLHSPVVQHHGPAHHRRVGPETRLPELVAEHHLEIHAGHAVLYIRTRRQRPPEEGLDTQHREEAVAHGKHVREMARSFQDVALPPHRHEVIKGTRLVAVVEVPVGPHQERRVRSHGGKQGPDLDEPVGVSVVQTGNQNGVDHTEHRGVRTDAQGDRDHGQSRHHRRAPADTNRYAQILNEPVEEASDSGLSLSAGGSAGCSSVYQCSTSS